MPKWDGKAERDLLLAMRIAQGENNLSKGDWDKAAEIMKTMGHADATGTGISQRWSKVILKNFREQQAQGAVKGGNGATSAADSAPAPAAIPGRRGRGKDDVNKRKKREQAQDYKGDAEQAHVTKKQKH
ncbi:hypothetical protein F5B22DRAFT_647603 [Xylaria bambusicola]|uniref:uncharacterized protein n=1 Tax=Xylaria bambusicola TaxID=326684 RepID=UPI002008D1A6|nr:uncharacterized protein F5B22DRAFT_647603 [Xylaria bambusicola]KAI0514564.1 hypothetical protein F5B22DRAFT_647603 [Xylaria bambusicola]